MFVSLVELDFPSPEFLLEFTLTLQVKKLEKKVRKLQQLLRAKAEQNTNLSARVTELEIADDSVEEEKEEEYGEYMEET